MVRVLAAPRQDAAYFRPFPPPAVLPRLAQREHLADLGRGQRQALLLRDRSRTRSSGSRQPWKARSKVLLCTRYSSRAVALP